MAQAKETLSQHIQTLLDDAADFAMDAWNSIAAGDRIDTLDSIRFAITRLEQANNVIRETLITKP